MGYKNEQGEKGLSAGVLAVLFLIWVVLCAGFFSLGFIVGYNEQSSKAETVSERVTPPSVVPPLVNPPTKVSPPPATEKVTAAREARNDKPSATFSVPPEEPKPSPPRAKARTTSEPATPPTSDTEAPPRQGAAASKEVRMGFTVQVDALRAKQDAEALVKILKARRYPVFLVTPEYANSRDNLYRVQVGPFTSRDDAEKVRDRLTQEGFKPFIRR